MILAIIASLTMTNLLQAQVVVVDPCAPAAPAPDITLTSKSTVDKQVKKIATSTDIVPNGGAVIQSVEFSIDQTPGGNHADGGAGRKVGVTTIWSMGNTIVLTQRNTYKVTTTVKYTVPGDNTVLTKTSVSGELKIP